MYSNNTDGRALSLTLTDVSDEPLHHQLTRQIRALILRGTLRASSPLPSIRGLARSERVSVITVQRAYEELERDGLVHARRGKGFFVACIPNGQKRARAERRLEQELAGVVARARAEGLDSGRIRAVFDRSIRKEGPAS